MSLVRVHEVEVIAARVLRVGFSDGLVRELDFVSCQKGLFASLNDDEVFDAVAVDPVRSRSQVESTSTMMFFMVTLLRHRRSSLCWFASTGSSTRPSCCALPG